MPNQMDPKKRMGPARVSLLLFTFGAVSLGLFFVAAYGWKEGHVTGGVLWSGACLFAGGLGGFLFGIPKTVQNAKNPADPQDTQKVNTNLEDISDWVTKIIVGLGLANLAKIPPRAQAAAAYISHTWNDKGDLHAFGYALMLYFSVVGFLGGYLLTRIFLSPMFRDADAGGVLGRLAGGGSPPDLLSLLKWPASGSGGGTADAAETTGAVLTAYQALEKKSPPAALDPYIKQLEKLKTQFPVFRMLYIVLGRLYRATSDYDKAIAVLGEFIKNKETAGRSVDGDTAAAYYNRACYEVQKSEGLADPDKKTLRDAAIADLTECFRRAPENRDYASKDADLAPILAEIPKGSS